MGNDYEFNTPLKEGIIIDRPNRFVMVVLFCGEEVRCHCPCVGRIGNFPLGGRPCLLSRSSSPSRGTPYTVEAISLCMPTDRDKSWIGINQTRVNRYVEHFLRSGLLGDMVPVPPGSEVLREVTVGSSRIDFAVGDHLLEVKMPLWRLQVDLPPHIATSEDRIMPTPDRIVRQLQDLNTSLPPGKSVILLVCFLYDNPGFRVRGSHPPVMVRINRMIASGRLQLWQANMGISPSGVTLNSYFRLGDVMEKNNF